MIIGVSGKKRSGKDTFYSLIKNKVSNVKRYAFADSVKEYASAYFNVPFNEIKNEENRFILQGIGQMFREEVDESYWIRKTIGQILSDSRKNTGQISVITDVRYRNEADAILEQDNSFLLRIINKNNDVFDPHISENDLNDYAFDFTIENNGSMFDYESRVNEWISKNLPWIIL